MRLEQNLVLLCIVLQIRQCHHIIWTEFYLDGICNCVIKLLSYLLLLLKQSNLSFFYLFLVCIFYRDFNHLPIILDLFFQCQSCWKLIQCHQYRVCYRKTYNSINDEIQKCSFIVRFWWFFFKKWNLVSFWVTTMFLTFKWGSFRPGLN